MAGRRTRECAFAHGSEVEVVAIGCMWFVTRGEARET